MRPTRGTRRHRVAFAPAERLPAVASGQAFDENLLRLRELPARSTELRRERAARPTDVPR